MGWSLEIGHLKNPSLFIGLIDGDKKAKGIIGLAIETSLQGVINNQPAYRILQQNISRNILMVYYNHVIKIGHQKHFLIINKRQDEILQV